MKKKNGLIKTSLACALIFGGVGLLAGCGNDDPGVKISDVYVTGDFADTVKEFVLGSDVSLSGAIVTVSFSDGTTETVTVTDDMWTKTDYDFATVGEKEITVKFTINGEEKTETIKIKIVNPTNVQTVIDAIAQLTSDSSVDRWMESTADSIKTSYNSLGDTEKSLVTNYNDFFTAYKTIKKDVISNYVELTDYEESDRATVSEHIDTAVAAINNATNLAGVDTALQTAKTSINAIETTLQARIKVVLECFDTYVEETFDQEDYSPLKWTLLQATIETVRNEIATATNIVFLPDVTNGYFNSNFLKIDTLVTENFKNRIAELPEVSSITEYDEDLMEEVKAILNTYKNNLTQEEKGRISSELIDQVEDVEFALGTLDLDDYKEEVVVSINEFLSKENEYDEEEWHLIEEAIEEAIYYIEAETYDEYAKGSIDERYQSLFNTIYNHESIKLKRLEQYTDLMWYYQRVNSTKFVYDESAFIYGVYNVYDNKFMIEDKMYTIDGNQIREGSNVYPIENGKFTMDTKVLSIVDLSTNLNVFKDLYNSLSEGEKTHDNALQAIQLIQKYEGVVEEKIAYANAKLESLNVYLDDSVYNPDRIEQIQSIIDYLKYSSRDGYQMTDYKESFDTAYNSAISNISYVNNKLDDIKESLRDLLIYSTNDYYENELLEVYEIIDAAVEAGEAVEKGVNETVLEAVARVQAIIDAANEEIDAVKTWQEVYAEEKTRLLAELREYINVDDYTDIDELSDLDAELTNDSPEIVKAYKEAVESIEYNHGSISIDTLRNTFERAKSQIIDSVGRTYVVTLDGSNLNDRIMSVFNNSSDRLSNEYFVEIGNMRTNVRNNTWYLPNNGLIERTSVTINGNVYEDICDFKVENGKLYLALPYLMFKGPSISFNVSFVDTQTTDIYTIVLDGISEADSAVTHQNISVHNYGEEYDTEEEVGFYPSNNNTFASYKRNSVLNFEYKNGLNYVTGSTIVKRSSRNGVDYTFMNLGEQSIDIYPNGINESGWAIEHNSFADYKVSIYNSQTGIDVNDLEFRYIEYVCALGARETYQELIDKKLNENGYLPNDKQTATQIANEFKQKYGQVTTIDQLEKLWESNGDVGQFYSQDNTAVIEGNSYTINEGIVKWFDEEVGSYISTFAENATSSINIGEITLNVEDNNVYLNGKNIGVYDDADNKITFYTDLVNSDLDQSLVYMIEEGNLTRAWDNYLKENVGTVVITGENTMTITLNARQYIVSGADVIDENKIGFINRLSEVETVADPIVKIGEVELELNKEEMPGNTYYGGYYEYEIKLNEENSYLEVLISDPDNVKVDFSSWGFDCLPVSLEQLGSGVYSINLYANDEQTLLRQYHMVFTKERAFDRVVFDGHSVEWAGSSYDLELGEIPELIVDVKDGYEYEISVNHNKIDNLSSANLLVGENEITIEVYVQGDEDRYMTIDQIHFFVNYGKSVYNSITFNGENIGDYGNVIVHDGDEATLVEVETTSNTVESMDVLDEYGNSVLNEGKIDMTNRPFRVVNIKVTVGGQDYYIHRILIINMSEQEYCVGEIYRDDWDNQTNQNIPGLREYIDIKYDENLTLVKGEGWTMFENQFEYVKVTAPKNYDPAKITASVNGEWSGEQVTITFARCGNTNIYKLVVKNSSEEIDTITYFEIEEAKHEINDDANIMGGSVTIEEFMTMDDIDSDEEAIEALQGKMAILTQETITSDDEYYQEGIDEYYSATIRARMGDVFFAMPYNYFVSSYTVTGDFLMNIDYDSPFYFFFSDFETGDVIIVDITSPDGTKQVRYIYHIEKTAPDIGAQIIIGEGNEAVTTPEADFIINMGMLTEGMMYGDFIAMDDYGTIFVAFAGEQEVAVGEEVTLKLRISDLLKSNGALTIDGNYDKDDPTSYLSEADLNGVSINVTSVEIEQDVFVPGITFFAHQLDQEGNEYAVISYTLLFMENIM